MIARKLILGSLLALAFATTVSTPNVAHAGSGHGGGYRGAHVTVVVNWQNRYGQTYQTRMTGTYWFVLGGLGPADVQSMAYHVRNMNAQGYYWTRWNYEHPRYFY
jgi:hypothetical protein